jgi:putative transposase
MSLPEQRKNPYGHDMSCPSEKNTNKNGMINYNPDHHRRSIRLKGYDYSHEGLYFITICIKDRKCLFGKVLMVENTGVENYQPRKEMILNESGKIAHECWLEIPRHFPNTVLHEHIVMPNHVHGIIELKQVDVGTQHIVTVPIAPKYNQFSKPIPGSISVIIQQYKSSVTRILNGIKDSDFKWQSRFYEQIIRNDQSFDKISDYIINNPKNWKEDDLFQKDHS